jgi:hypothetical protein
MPCFGKPLNIPLGRIATVALFAAAGCQPNPPTKYDATLPYDSAGAIPDGPVTGRIRTLPFKAKDMRYWIDRRQGREKVDIKLSAGSATEPCGPRKPENSTSVWIRLPSHQSLKIGERRRSAQQQTAWSVHYQTKQEGYWLGNGNAAALLLIRSVRPDFRIEGDLAACFADGHDSCVAGSFTARYCPDPLDPGIRDLGPPVDAGNHRD